MPVGRYRSKNVDGLPLCEGSDRYQSWGWRGKKVFHGSGGGMGDNNMVARDCAIFFFLWGRIVLGDWIEWVVLYDIELLLLTPGMDGRTDGWTRVCRLVLT